MKKEQKPEYPDLDRRKYIRLDSVFPVAFSIRGVDKDNLSGCWIQGFTNNLSRGGLCVTVNNLKAEFKDALFDPKAKLALKIEIPLTRRCVSATGKATWIQKLGPKEEGRYALGVAYEVIDKRQNSIIMRYARAKKLFAPLTLSVIVIISIGLLFNTYISLSLMRVNKTMADQLVKVVQESSIAKQKIKETVKERQDLQVKLQEAKLRIDTVEEQLQSLKDSQPQAAIQLQGLVKELELDRPRCRSSSWPRGAKKAR